MSDVMIDGCGTDDGEPLLSLAGEVDLSHVGVLWETAMEALATAPRRLVVDLSAVSFLDSSILGMLVRIQRAAEEQGKGFSLRRPAPIVQRVLRLTGLEDRFPVER